MGVDLNLLEDLRKLPRFVDVYQTKFSNDLLLTYGLNGCFSVFIFDKKLEIGILSHFPPFFFDKFKKSVFEFILEFNSNELECILIIHARDKGGSLPVKLNDFLNQIFLNRITKKDFYYYDGNKIGVITFNLKEKVWESSEFGKKFL